MQGLLASVSSTLIHQKPQDAKSHYVHNYVKTTDLHIGKLRDAMDGYIRNLERIKKKTVKKSMFLKQYGEAEDNPDSEFGIMLSDFSEMLLEKENAREELIARVDVMCLNPLKMYGTLCQKLKEEVRMRDTAVAKEQQLEKDSLKESPSPKRNQSKMAGAAQEVAHCTTNLIDATERFEMKKRDDIKSILSELLWSEIKYHSKVLEILSEHHQKLGEVTFPGEVHLADKLRSYQPPAQSPARSFLSPFSAQ